MWYKRPLCMRSSLSRAHTYSHSEHKNLIGNIIWWCHAPYRKEYYYHSLPLLLSLSPRHLCCFMLYALPFFDLILSLFYIFYRFCHLTRWVKHWMVCFHFHFLFLKNKLYVCMSAVYVSFLLLHFIWILMRARENVHVTWY